MSPPAATYMRPGAGLYIAGTGTCVHVPFRLSPIASLAWLGKQLPCPLQKFYIYSDVPHTRLTEVRNKGPDHEMKMRMR